MKFYGSKLIMGFHGLSPQNSKLIDYKGIIIAYKPKHVPYNFKTWTQQSLEWDSHLARKFCCPIFFFFFYNLLLNIFFLVYCRPSLIYPPQTPSNLTSSACHAYCSLFRRLTQPLSRHLFHIPKPPTLKPPPPLQTTNTGWGSLIRVPDGRG